jgi:hypothetical protein
MFNITTPHVWWFSGCNIDAEPDYENNRMRVTSYGSSDGYLVSLTDLSDEDVEWHLGFDEVSYQAEEVVGGKVA